MKDIEQRYFNVPIQLLEGFLLDKNQILNNIVHFACYEYCTSKNAEISQAEWFFNITVGNPKKAMKDGKALLESIPVNSPKIGVNVHKLFEFLKEEKPEFKQACFLAFLALRSIIQNKSFCKIDNKFLLSRMDGKPKAVKALTELSEAILKYASEYQTVKIKRALVETWGLVTYSRYTRGFYVSFSMSLPDLIFEAEKRRKSVIAKQYKAAEKEALKMALERLEKSRP